MQRKSTWSASRSPLLPPARPTDRVELARIIVAHEEWLRSGRLSGQRAELFNLSLPEVDLSGHDLSFAKFELCDLHGARFAGARLQETWLHGTDLGDADLAGAHAVKAQFLSAHCQGASFRASVLDGASFMFAKLDGADFTRTSLCRADFEDAEYRGAIFRAAVLDGVTLRRWYLTEAQIEGATRDDRTILPGTMAQLLAPHRPVGAVPVAARPLSTHGKMLILP